MKLKKAVIFSENPAAVPGLCAVAAALADEIVVLAVAAKGAAEALLPYASEVIWLGDQAEGSMIEDYVPALAERILALAPRLVLTGTSSRDRCISARLAVRLGAGVITDISGARIGDDGTLIMTRSVYGGTASATVRAAAAITVAVVPEGVFGEAAAGAAGRFTESPAAPEKNGIERLSVDVRQEERVNLSAAKRVIGVGRGLGAGKNLAPVEAFASKIGAELACTRPIAEEEALMAKNRYVGVSGLSIRPDVYIACGISGQVQHMVGVNASRVIIAVNKDAKAAIFQNCDYGIVGDMNKIIPALDELL